MRLPFLGLIMFTLGAWPVYAESEGIHFDLSPSWRVVLEKAQRENKYIFVDCFTTWCTPCKRMDAEVFVREDVGHVFNRRYISVKLQMDSTPKDSELVKSRYVDAKLIDQQYKINSYPTFLFFSPQGELIKTVNGFTAASEFIEFGWQLSGGMDYAELKAKYIAGARDYSVSRFLVETAIKENDIEFSNQVAREYIDHWLLKLPEGLLYQMKNLEFIARYIINTQDPAFRLFFENSAQIDIAYAVDQKIEKKSAPLASTGNPLTAAGYSASVIDRWIIAEEIAPYFFVGGKKSIQSVKWSKVKKTISKKYGRDVAERCISKAKAQATAEPTF